MSDINILISRVESTAAPCRRLDAEATGWALAPAGWVIDPVEDIDGWAIEYAPDAEGEAATWMCAADVGYVTRYMDAAMELITEARPDEAARIAARALLALLARPWSFADAAEFTQRAACQMIGALLRSIVTEQACFNASLVA